MYNTQYYSTHNMPFTDLFIEFNDHFEFYFVDNDATRENKNAFWFRVRKLLIFLKF